VTIDFHPAYGNLPTQGHSDRFLSWIVGLASTKRIMRTRPLRPYLSPFRHAQEKYQLLSYALKEPRIPADQVGVPRWLPRVVDGALLLIKALRLASLGSDALSLGIWLR